MLEMPIELSPMNDDTRLLPTPPRFQPFAVDLEAQKLDHHGGLHWLPPVLMLLSFLGASGASVAHHAYYSLLRGKEVGNDIAQQAALG